MDDCPAGFKINARLNFIEDLAGLRRRYSLSCALLPVEKDCFPDRIDSLGGRDCRQTSWRFRGSAAMADAHGLV